MASPAYAQLLVVQGHDTLIDQLRHKHATHTLRSELVDIETEIAAVDSVIEGIEKRRHDLDRERKRLDDEVAKVRRKRDELNTKLYDGSVTDTKDLLAMQEEVKHMAERQTGLEDEELDFMEKIEEVSTELAGNLAKRQALQETHDAKTVFLEAALEEIDSEVASEIVLRAESAAEVPAELLAAYDRLRADFGGIAVAKLNGSSCDGCHMTLSAVTVDRFNQAAPDAVINCDECGRLLIL